ncbi:hypothetical protein HDK90DRAFT_267466 [Phyllosticta capitalensis]|uniref:Uncharacterized protein n=1 Tax=Phyllosticta capitalensis TaxID=121624 RepID=A0ABR1YLS2_9PEZI
MQLSLPYRQSLSALSHWSSLAVQAERLLILYRLAGFPFSKIEVISSHFEVQLTRFTPVQRDKTRVAPARSVAPCSQDTAPKHCTALLDSPAPLPHPTGICLHSRCWWRPGPSPPLRVVLEDHQTLVVSISASSTLGRFSTWTACRPTQIPRFSTVLHERKGTVAWLIVNRFCGHSNGLTWCGDSTNTLSPHGDGKQLWGGGKQCLVYEQCLVPSLRLRCPLVLVQLLVLFWLACQVVALCLCFARCVVECLEPTCKCSSAFTLFPWSPSIRRLV